ncbi:MAG: TonB-dependent receptor [Cellvibrionaceae bacterium]|nr:TonB-dependent receptor [Cellvibrionaceae bacterium]
MIPKYAQAALLSLSGLSSSQVAIANSQEKSVQLEEIVVTASRREENLQDVAASVASVDPQALQAHGFNELQDIIEYTPGVSWEDGGGRGVGTITMRGIPQSGAIRTVGIYVDDTPLISASGFSGAAGGTIDASLIDLSRIEVIKGPQGTLYGASSVGGMIRYISRAPSLQEVRGEFSVDISHNKGPGSHNTIVSGRLSGPIIKGSLGATLSVFQADDAGFTQVVAAENGNPLRKRADQAQSKGVSVDLLWEVNESAQIKFKYLKQEGESDLLSSVTLLPGTDTPAFAHYSTINQPLPLQSETEISSVSFDYNFEWGQLNSVSSLSDRSVFVNLDRSAQLAPVNDAIYGLSPGSTESVITISNQDMQRFVQEIRLSSQQNQSFEWILGLFYMNEDSGNRQQAIPEPYLGTGLFDVSFPSAYEELAFFGDATWYFNEDLDITLGLRYSDHETEMENISSGPLTGPGQDLSQFSDQTVTYLATMRYRPNEQLSIYTRVASGYRPISANLALLNPATGENLAQTFVESDKIWSYEFGLKGFNHDASLQYELSLWYSDWDNFQTRFAFNGVSVGANAQGRLMAKGVDFNLSQQLFERLNLQLGISYSDSYLSDDEPGLGGIAGERYPGQALWSSSIQLAYELGDFQGWQANLLFAGRYIGQHDSSFSRSSTQQSIEVDAYTLVDSSLSLEKDSHQLSFYLNNLLDTQSIMNRTDTISGNGALSSSAIFTSPRTVGLRYRYQF